jgi:inner membrane transporter RhtA
MSLEPAAASVCGLLFLQEYFNEIIADCVVIASGSTMTSQLKRDVIEKKEV